MIMRTHRFVHIVGLLLFLISPRLVAQGTSNASGVDCECSKTGDYKDPTTGVAPTVNPDSTSPNGKYIINYSGTTVINLSVIRVSDQVTVYTTSFPQGSEPRWGFGPDDDRFVTQYTTGISPTSVRNLALIDLTKSSNNQIWTLAFSSMSDRIGFTKHGQYLYYFALYGTNQAHIEIVDAQTGDVAYTTEFTYSGASGAGKFGMATWGFSPDSFDRSFVYAYVSSPSYVQWYLINLEARTVVRNMQILSISGFWQFSPCGDVLGIVTQNTISSMDISLYKTVRNQSAIGDLPWNGVYDVVLKSTDTSHIANINGSDYTITDNYAGGLCVIAPVSITFEPDSVVGGNIVDGLVTLNGPASSGSQVVTLVSSDTNVATVPLSITIAEGYAEKNFAVRTKAVAIPSNVAIRASANGVTIRDTLHVFPTRVIAFEPDIMDVYGGDTLVATVTINHPAPSQGTIIKVVTDNATIIEVPSSVTVPADSTSKKFVIRTHEVESPIIAHISVITGRDTIENVIYIDPLVEVFVDPAVVVGGNSSRIYLTRGYTAPLGGLTFPVISSDTTVIASRMMTLYAGTKSTWDNLPTAGVIDTQLVVLSTTVGSVVLKDTVMVLPASLISNGALPDSGCTVGAETASGKIYIAGNPILYQALMDGDVPSTGADVSLISSRPDILSVPSSTLHFDGFSDQASYVLFSSENVSSPQQVIITASYRSTTLEDTITIVGKLPYTFIILDSTEEWSNPLAITNQGEILIWGGNDSTSIWRNGDRLGCPDGVGLNDSNQILSTHYLNDDPTRNYAVILSEDTTIIIPHPDSIYENCAGRALNNHGDVAVYCEKATYPDGPAKIAIWRNGTITLAGPIDEYWLDPTDINDSGIVVGYGVIRAVYYVPVVWDGDTLTVIPLPNNVNGQAAAVNNMGAIVGRGGPSWFIRERGVSTLVPLLQPWTMTEATDINDSGVVVGTMSRFIGEGEKLFSPFVFRGGFIYDLNCMVDLPEGWRLVAALKINNAGEIIGRAQYQGIMHAYLLRPGNTTGIHEELPPTRIPTTYSLEQNYPNPFNPITAFRYQLPEESNVSLKVYNLLGQIVAKLIDGRQQAGYQTIAWNAGSLSSGVYFYKLEAVPIGNPGKTYTSLKRMMLVK